MTSESVADLMFPIAGRSSMTTIVQHAGRSRRCPDRVWYADWYDARRTGPQGERRAHHAQDIFAPRGSEVVALEDGRVLASSATSGPSPLGGWWLSLEGQDGRRWYMAHLDQAPYVRVGARIAQGQLVGLVGQSGDASHACPHLHLGLKVRGRPTNFFEALRRIDPIAAPAADTGRGEVKAV